MKKHMKALKSATTESQSAINAFVQTEKKLQVQNDAIEKALLDIEADIQQLNQLKENFVSQHNSNTSVLGNIAKILRGGKN